MLSAGVRTFTWMAERNVILTVLTLLMKLTIKQDILSENDRIARENQDVFDRHGIHAVNVMGSPGAGKTSVILTLLQKLPQKIHAGVIEGDIASRIDTEKIQQCGYPAVQINTGGNCHLDAVMVKRVLQKLPLSNLQLIFIENVGNLVCPANVHIGTHTNLVVASIPEGDDKPYKYPGMFTKADAIVLSKTDLTPAFDFDRKYFKQGISVVNHAAPVFPVSGKNKKGIGAVIRWLRSRMR